MYYFARIYAAIVALSCLFCLSACQDEMLVSEGGKGNVDIVARMDGGIITRTCVGNSTDDGMVAHGTPCLPQLTREMCLRPYSRAT